MCDVYTTTSVSQRPAGLGAQSVKSATDTLGHWDVHMWLVCPRSLSKTVDQHLHYAHGCWHAVITSVGNCPPHVCAWEKYCTTPMSNDGVARLCPMVRLWVWVLMGADGVQAMFSGLDLTPKWLANRPNPHHWGALQPWTRPGLIDSKCKWYGYNTPKGKYGTVYTKMKKALGHQKNNNKTSVCTLNEAVAIYGSHSLLTLCCPSFTMPAVHFWSKAVHLIGTRVA